MIQMRPATTRTASPAADEPQEPFLERRPTRLHRVDPPARRDDRGDDVGDPVRVDARDRQPAVVARSTGPNRAERARARRAAGP